MSFLHKPMGRAWLMVALLWFVACLNYLDRVMITTMRESLVQAIPMTDAQFGLLTSVFLWTYGILSPFGGFLADRFSRSAVVMASLFVWSAVTWLTGHAKTFDQLLAARALMGISEACYIPAALALIADYHRGPTRSTATGIHMSGIMVGSGLGGIGGWLAERHSWSYSFNLFGIIGIGYSILLLFLLRDTQAEEPLEPAAQARSVRFLPALKSLFSRPSFLLILVFWALIAVASWAIVGWMPTYLGEHFNLRQGVAGLSATGYLQAAALVGVLVGGVWADRWSRKNERGRIFVPMLGLLLAGPGVVLAASTNWLPLAIAGLMLYGLARSFTDANMMPILCLVADARYRATGYGVLNLFSCFVGGASIYAGGALRDAQLNLNLLFRGAGISLLFCAGLLLLVKPSRSEPKRVDEP